MDGPDVGWYLIVAAMLFGIGALGVMLRRSPLIVLLSLEIMLNAANLTLIAFARQQGDLDGQIFALAVMAVAAAEVAIGLGLIVAMARRRHAPRRRPGERARGWMIAGAWVCLLAPLGGALAITLAGGADLAPRTAGWISTLTTFVAFAGALVAFFGLWAEGHGDREHLSTAYTWLAAGDFQVGFQILLDTLSSMMMLDRLRGRRADRLVLDGLHGGRRRGAPLLRVHVALRLLDAPARAGGELPPPARRLGPRRPRVVPADRVLAHKPEAVAAAKKAFVMNAIGDATFALALVLLIWETGTLEFVGVFEEVDGLSTTIVNLVALGLLGGAVAKSAQIPLHTWLPDAMEGPTPVSALIHAATMVTAGVYLLVRAHPIFEAAPDIQHLAAILGAITLLVAGVVALVQWDIKRVIAYSTMSQIGYMFLARRDRRLRLRDLPPDDARLLQGAALHVGGRRHPPPGRRAGHPEDGRPQGAHAAHAHRVPRRRARARRASRSSRASGRRTASSRPRSRATTRSVRSSTPPGSSVRCSPGSTRSASTSRSSAGSRATLVTGARARGPRRGPALDARPGRRAGRARDDRRARRRSRASGSPSCTGSTRRPSRSSTATVAQDYGTSAIAVSLGARRLLRRSPRVPRGSPARREARRSGACSSTSSTSTSSTTRSSTGPAAAVSRRAAAERRGAGRRALARRDRRRGRSRSEARSRACSRGFSAPTPLAIAFAVAVLVVVFVAVR